MLIAAKPSISSADKEKAGPLLLPSSTQVSVNANQGYKLIQLGLSESQFGSKVIGFVGQHLQVTGGPAFITHLRKPGRILGREC